MSTIIKAPWSKEFVDILNAYQQNPDAHPYTCEHCRNIYGTRFIIDENGKLIKEPSDFKPWEGDNWKKVIFKERKLVATRKGWVCKTCNNIQDWCYDFSIL
jgi:hypothetical protein